MPLGEPTELVCFRQECRFAIKCRIAIKKQTFYPSLTYRMPIIISNNSSFEKNKSLISRFTNFENVLHYCLYGCVGIHGRIAINSLSNNNTFSISLKSIFSLVVPGEQINKIFLIN